MMMMMRLGVLGALFFFTAFATVRQRTGIRAVDFGNFAYELKDYELPHDKLTLRNGRYKAPGGGIPPIVAANLVSVAYADFDRDGQEEAAVQLHVEVSGSAGSFENYLVYAYRNDAAQEIFRESREQGKRMSVMGRTITFSAPFWRDKDAHCCPSALATETYARRGSKFVRVSRRLSALRTKG
jgi:hypothetical protein